MDDEGVRALLAPEPAVELCPRGLHPMVGDNVYEWEGWDKAKEAVRHIRRCRACQKEASRRSALKRRKKKARRKEDGLTELGIREFDDLDIALLKLLPDEGAKLGKYLDDMRTANQLLKTLDDPYISSGMLGRKLSFLREKGLVVQAGRSGAGGKRAAGYQRTEKGKKLSEGESE